MSPTLLSNSNGFSDIPLNGHEIGPLTKKSSTHTNGSVGQIGKIGNIGIVGNGHSQKTESCVEP